MKKIVILGIMLVITTLLFSYNTVYATKTAGTTTIDSVIQEGKDFIGSANTDNPPIDGGDLRDVSDMIYNVLLAVAIVGAVIVSAVLGIKFITGSVEEQVDVKKALTPFIVGCIVAFGAFAIWKLVLTLISTLPV